METQQRKPSKIGFPPERINFTIFVFKPMAAIAIMIKNLLSSFNNAKIRSAKIKASPLKTAVTIVVTKDATTNQRINMGKIFLMLTSMLPFPDSFFDFFICQKVSTKTMGIIANVLVNLTMVAYSSTAPFVP